MSNGSIFNFKAILLFVFLIVVHEVVLFILPDSNNNQISPIRWHSRGILQQQNGTKYSTSNPKESEKCFRVISKYNSSLLCHYVKTTPDCQLTDGFFQYLYFPYCVLPRNFAFFILALWLIFLFIVLGITADEYFCPSLDVICKTLKMSQNVAGVTFLAYGNGTPDIFSVLAAFSHSKEDRSAPELGIQALFGAGVFVTTVVVGCISLCTPNGVTVTQLPFVRDVVFYICAVGWIVLALHNQELSLFESIGLIVFYVVYALAVIIGHYVYQYWKNKKRAARPSGDAVISSILESTFSHTNSRIQGS